MQHFFSCEGITSFKTGLISELAKSLSKYILFFWGFLNTDFCFFFLWKNETVNTHLDAWRRFGVLADGWSAEACRALSCWCQPALRGDVFRRRAARRLTTRARTRNHWQRACACLSAVFQPSQVRYITWVCVLEGGLLNRWTQSTSETLKTNCYYSCFYYKSEHFFYRFKVDLLQIVLDRIPPWSWTTLINSSCRRARTWGGFSPWCWNPDAFGVWRI